MTNKTKTKETTEHIKDKDIVPVLQSQANPLTHAANTLSIATEEEKRDATLLLSQLNTILDASTADREKITKPLNAALKEVRAKYKPLDTILEEAIATLRQKLSAYQTQQKSLADAEAARIAARVGEGRGHLLPSTAVAKIAQIDTPSDHVETDAGSLTFRTDQQFEVIDISKLPIEYHLPHEVAIRAAMKAGVQLAGVRYFEVQIPINSRR